MTWETQAKLSSFKLLLVRTHDSYFEIFFSVLFQDYATRVNDFDVILGNSALLKCDIPSFVNDFINVIAWIENETQEMYIEDNYVRGKKYRFFFSLGHTKFKHCFKAASLYM